MKQTTNNSIFYLKPKWQEKNVENIGNHLPSSISSSLITSAYSMLHKKA
jgi:hypothetical protein